MGKNAQTCNSVYGQSIKVLILSRVFFGHKKTIVKSKILLSLGVIIFHFKGGCKHFFFKRVTIV